MRTLFVFIGAIILTTPTLAQSPQKLSYQAVIRNNSNVLVESSPIGMRISILQGSETGTPVYVETLAPSTNGNGLVTIEIGANTPVTGSFAGINWSAGPYYIKTETDPNGGTNYAAIIGISQLLSVPYALYAKTAGVRYIGELYGGGIVVAFWNTGGVEHGLIASLTNVSSGSAWSNVTSVLVGATAASVFDGQSNTNAIIAQPGHSTSAAKLCDDYISEGFDDWYLPAAWELNQCYNQVFVINQVLGENGFQYNGFYWCSTEVSSTFAFSRFIYNGISTAESKSNAYTVRAVRRF